MECRVVDHLLDEYVDNRLSPEAAAAVARHLDTCPACRELAEDLRRLLGGAKALPAEVEPPRELWGRIEGELSRPRPGRVHHGRFGGLAGGWMGGVLAAAAAVALVVATVVVVRRDVGPEETTAKHDTAASRVLLAALAESGFDDEMIRVRVELREALASRRDALAPETIAVVDENLAIIEWALAEIERAIEVDPGNRQLVRLLVATYQQEIDLLTQVSLGSTA